MRMHGLRVLGLSMLAVLGVMAFTAVAAQAEELTGTKGDPWHVLNGTITGTETQNVTGKQAEEGELEVPERNLRIKCPDAEVNEGLLLKEGDAHAKLVFLGCKAFNITPGEELPCMVTNTLKITAEALLLLVLHNGEYYVLAEPKTGQESFTTVEFESGTGCSLPLKNKVTGSVVGKVSQIKEVKPKIEFNKTITALFSDQLKFGIFPSFIIGKAEAELTGTNVGCTWGVA